MGGCDVWEAFVDTGANTQPETVVLRPGESTWIIKAGLFLTFEKVVQDSRCPTGAVCVWAGDGEVQLSVQQAGGVTMDYRLHTNLDPKAVEVDVWRISLKKLDPYPVLGATIDPAAYIVTLEVTPAAGTP
jgi:hypothetical protein